MSNFQELSLNENVVFLPVDESSPDFLHSEREREAVEKLLSGGPEAFYSSIGSERSGCFLSPEEVSQISSWAQKYHINPSQVEEQNGEGNSSETEDFCSTYSPSVLEEPIPSLDLGWPCEPPRVRMSNVILHTSPSAEGTPSVREIIRRHLQNARQVIAIVTDKLTDNVIISDLHTAASRGVPVYIILNQRSIQENFTLNKLRHSNMRVRVLGGKTFCSRTGRVVTGEMKKNFILLDLETVIHGSYSLTWTDAHLHRQLITVLTGPVLDFFDMEFRTLFASSLPVHDTWTVPTGGRVHVHPQIKNSFSPGRLKRHPVEPEITNPPSPPAEIVLDWEAMGVTNRDSSTSSSPFDLHEDVVAEKRPQQEENIDRAIIEHQFGDKMRIHENTSPGTTRRKDKSVLNNSESSTSNTSAILRLENPEEKDISRELSQGKHLIFERIRRRVEKPSEPAHPHASARRRQSLDWEAALIEERTMDEQSSRKPLILKAPQCEGFSSLNDILSRLKRGTPGLLGRRMNSAISERTQSMMDLSDGSADLNPRRQREVPGPRFLGSLDLDGMTPALALMKKRNNDLKSALNRPPKAFVPTERRRSCVFNDDIHMWNSLSEWDEEK